MDSTLARRIAHVSHGGSRDRHGEPVIEHVRRVVAAVPAEARAVAWLHDVLEKSATTLATLRAQGLTDAESDALALLTRTGHESYERHVQRIADAPGASGRLARTVKLADLDDHLARRPAPGDPPYDWARRHIAGATLAQASA
jgi:hypothetical protein